MGLETTRESYRLYVFVRSQKMNSWLYEVLKFDLKKKQSFWVFCSCQSHRLYRICNPMRTGHKHNSKVNNVASDHFNIMEIVHILNCRSNSNASNEVILMQSFNM